MENDIEFLHTYWKKAQNIGLSIKENLPKLTRPNESIQKSGNMYLVKFSDLKESWSVEDVLKKNGGSSSNLEALASKLNDMILRHRAIDIKIMLNSILTGKIKVWSNGTKNNFTKGKRNKRREKKKNYEIIRFYYSSEDKYCTGEDQDFSYGHFRYESKGYILTNEELLHVKRYFNL